MERYKARTGVILTSVCGEYLLVASRGLKEICPFVTSVNDSTAFLWKRLIGGATEDELLAAVAEEYEVEDPAALRKVIRDFLAQMREMNYLLTEEQDKQAEEKTE